jgi:hypothetical protein
MSRIGEVAGYVFAIFVVLFMICVAVSIAHGTVTPSPLPNSLGVNETYQNPNSYLLALPLDSQILDGRFTNIRFKPYATPVLFDETVLFCGDVIEMFEGKQGTVIVTYRTRAAGRYQGVGCHNLISVFEVHNDQRSVKP